MMTAKEESTSNNAASMGSATDPPMVYQMKKRGSAGESLAETRRLSIQVHTMKLARVVEPSARISSSVK